MSLEPVAWEDLPSTSTPLSAALLNAMQAYMQAQADAAATSAATAETAAEAAAAPTDEMVAAAISTLGTETRNALTAVLADVSSAVSVKDYGATGDGTTPDSAAIQDAIDAASTFGLDTYFPPGRYLLDVGLVIGSNATLRGAGRGVTILDATGLGAALGAGQTAITATGALAGSATATVSVDITRNSKSCTVSSAAGLAIGDMVLLSSDQLFATTAALKKGEIKRIENIVGTTVTFEDATYDSYTAASPTILTKFTTWLNAITIESLTVEGTNVDNMERGVYIYGADDVVIRNCTFNYCDWNAVNLRNVTNFKVTGNTFLSVPWIDNGPNYYGLVVENASAHGVFSGNHGTKCRHLFTTGYTTTTPGATRFVVVSGNVDTYSQSASFDTHNGCEFVTIIGNTSSYSEAAGINVESRQTQVIGNTVLGFSTYGMDLRDGFSDCTVADNRVTTSVSGTTGIYLRKTSSANPTRIVISGNTVFAESAGIRLDEARVVTVANNVVSPASGYPYRAITCQDVKFLGNTATSGTTAFRLEACTRMTVNNNDTGTCTTGVELITSATDTLIVGNFMSQNTTPVGTTFGTTKIAHNMGLATHNV